MSHFTKVSVQISDIDLFEQVLRDMGITNIQRGDDLINKSYYDTGQQAVLLVKKADGKQIGLNWGDLSLHQDSPGLYQIGIDSYDKKVADHIAQQYSRALVKQTAEANGWIITSEILQLDGTYKFTFSKWESGEKNLDVNMKESGEIEIETSGYQGEDCKPAMDQIKQGVGGIVLDDKTTPEGFAPGDSGISAWKFET